MTTSRFTQAAAIAVILTGCGMSQYEDISEEPIYRPLVGQQLEATTELVLHAVTLDRNYAEQVDTCSITAPPGFGGPELIYRRALPAGTTFRVLSVRECANCPLDDRVQLVVRPEGIL